MTQFNISGNWRKTIRVLPQAVVVYVLLALLVIIMLGAVPLYIFLIIQGNVYAHFDTTAVDS